MPNLVNSPAAIVLPKSANSARARFHAANRASRLFFSPVSLNRVNVRGPRVPHPELSRGGDLGWVHGTAETNRPFVEYPTFDLAWRRGTTHKFALQAGRGMAERGR